MQLVTRMLEPASSRPPEEQVALAAERRQFLKRRWRGVAEDGTEFGFDLGSRLAEGGVIFQQGSKDYVVRQLPEVVYEVPFASPAHAALVAWKTGNLHLPAQIFDDRIRVLHDEAMAQLLDREGWAFTEPIVLFQPLKAIAHAL
jgi:urease accessory protein